jgi:hypothetical protein
MIDPGKILAVSDRLSVDRSIRLVCAGCGFREATLSITISPIAAAQF